MYTSFWLPNFHLDIVGANSEPFENNLQKTRVNITIVHTFTKKLLSASAVNFQTKHYICEQHINDTSNIQKTTIANNNLSEDLKKQI